MLKEHLRSSVGAMAVLLLSTISAYAQTIAYDIAPQAGNQVFTGNMGLDFDVNSPITVVQLGAFDNNGDGFTGSVQVAIFDRDTGSPVTPTVTFTGTAGTLVNGERLLPLSSGIVLGIGHYSVVAVGFNTIDMNGNLGHPGAIMGSTLNTGGGSIWFVGTGRYDFNTTLDFPGNLDNGPANRYLAGTFQFTPLVLSLNALAPSLTESFGAQSINPTETTALTFTLQNPNAFPLTGVAFTAPLSDELVITTPNGLTGSCGGGTIIAAAGRNWISLTGAIISGNGSCTFGVNVTVAGLTGGMQNDTTSPVTSNEAPAGAPGSASLLINDTWFWSFFR
jgi:hypothetical protein